MLLMTVREGIVEHTSCDSLSDSQGFYLPHHAVIHSDKPTSRIRIVFDGSAHEDGHLSLNQSLYTGPNLPPNILEFLLCIPKSPVAFTADVKSAFLQIELDLRDRDFMFLLQGVETESSETSAIDLRQPTKVLELAWDPEKDLIYFDPKDLLNLMSHREELKRFILSVDLWTLGVDWNSKLLPKLRHKWQQWSSEAESLTEIKIPQFYLGGTDQEISKFEIHCFSDASKLAYGTILYLRFVTCNKEIETSFICSKSRVAPLKSLTLPRLELTAALLSARLAKQVSSCLKFDANIYYWTDSIISYYWICGDSSAFKPYVKNCVQEIQLLSDTIQWGHCPGKDSPADLLLNGSSAVKLAQNELWWHGTPWLKLTTDHWPNHNQDILGSELCSEELEHRSSMHVAVTQQRDLLLT
ncbi:integrase catalytic domain-containing protein [Trichonephila inaurata madagascariensis]|uniref:Integrase catalytic domain-containing protein n=1 Tax=Trichonephila inaurata madagascariensis TaxID=2747483 RepID=A0A8X7C4I5_9ARAC|nr:integrase catalytic domain-containing protein [Trichonephila inaurata madagascariensis]